MDTQFLVATPNSECKCNCHSETLRISNKLAVAFQENKSLTSQIHELEYTLNATDAQIRILNEKNGLLNDLLMRHAQNYKDVVSENEKLKLHQKYAPSPHDTDHDDHLKDELIHHLQTNTESLKQLNNDLMAENHKFKESIQTLQIQLENKNKELIETQKDKTCHENTLRTMGEELSDKNEEINQKNHLIHSLKEKISLLSSSNDSHEPITSSMQKTIIMDKNQESGWHQYGHSDHSPKCQQNQSFISSVLPESDVFGHNHVVHHRSTSSYGGFPEDDDNEDDQVLHRRTSSYAPFPDDGDDVDGDRLITNNGSSNQIVDNQEMSDLRKSNDDLMEEVKKLKEYIRENIVE